MEGATEERDENRGADDAAGRPSPRQASSSSHVDRVSFSSPSSRPRAASCWGRLKIRRIGRSSAHSRRSGSGTGMGGGDENGATTPSAATAASSRACLGGGRGRCGCRCRGVPDAAAAGARSLLQRNDFYCDDCNTHR